MGRREIKEGRNDVGGPIIGPIISGAWRVHTVNIIQIHTYTHNAPAKAVSARCHGMEYAACRSPAAQRPRYPGLLETGYMFIWLEEGAYQQGGYMLC